MMRALTAGVRPASFNEHRAASTEAKGRTWSKWSVVLVAVCLALGWPLPTGNSWAASLDAQAYGITARPSPGPVLEYQPDKSLAPIPFALPFDWGMDPYHDRTWRFRLHTLRIVDGALVAGDFDYARDVFLDWQLWHENCWWSSFLCFARASEQSWDDMATGIRASRLAYLLRSTGWEEPRLVELAEQHAEKLQDPAFFAGNHNHALFQLHGLAALCVDHKLRACRSAMPFLKRETAMLLRGQFTKSGMHRENSPYYHFFVADQFARTAPLLEPFAPELKATLQRAEENNKWLVHPDRTLVQLGDTNAKLYSRWRKKLVMPPGDPRCRNVRSYGQAPGCYLIKHFEDAGYAIVRSDWATAAANASMLLLRGGFFNSTHRDADDLSFEWFEHGRKILSDSGKYIVVSEDPFRDYFNSTRAHSTIEVDGEDYSRRDEDAYGSAVKLLKREPDEIAIVLQVHHDALEFGHRREIHYRPGQGLTLIDAVQSERGGPRRYVQWHHFDRVFELSGEHGRFQASDGEVSVALEVTSSCGESTTYEMVKGQTEPRIQGWASVANRERHPRWALGVVCEAETANFTAHFTLGEAARARDGESALASQR
jgi:Heparinase II/III-like protein/Heparinase II/III N-terminus